MRELRAFLMTRRARILPENVGLARTARRRTPGLRRDDVAELAGVSTAWYTAFEMAKDMRVSPETIGAIARALQLSPTERQHLYMLAGAPALPATPPPFQAIDPFIVRVLDAHGAPGLLLGRRLDVLAMNAHAVELFGSLTQVDGNARNWLWQVFAGRGQLRIIGRENGFERSCAGAFRMVYCENANDATFRALLDALLRESESFHQYWDAHDVATIEEPQALSVQHPTYGELHFDTRALPALAHDRAYALFFLPTSATDGSDAYAQLVRNAGLRTAEIGVF